MSENSGKLIVNVFGKEGCQKCAMLNRRLDKLLGAPRFAQFEKKYNNVMTEDGMMKFCLAQCLNPSRIPAMLISRIDENGKETYLPNPHPGEQSEVYGHSKLFQFLGIQTDYSDEGKGIITPEMIESVLVEALNAAC